MGVDEKVTVQVGHTAATDSQGVCQELVQETPSSQFSHCCQSKHELGNRRAVSQTQPP